MSRYKVTPTIALMTSSNGNIFRVTLFLWGDFIGHRCILLTKARDGELWYFFDLRWNKRLSEPSRHRWFEAPSRSLWRHCNVPSEMRHWAGILQSKKNPVHITTYMHFSVLLWVVTARFPKRLSQRHWGYNPISSDEIFKNFMDTDGYLLMQGARASTAILLA